MGNSKITTQEWVNRVANIILSDRFPDEKSQQELVWLASKSLPESDWIRVEDKLPEWDLEGNMSEEVLCKWQDGSVSISRNVLVSMDNPKFFAKCGTQEGEEGWNGNVGYVEKWMPLPK